MLGMSIPGWHNIARVFGLVMNTNRRSLEDDGSEVRRTERLRLEERPHHSSKKDMFQTRDFRRPLSWRPAPRPATRQDHVKSDPALLSHVGPLSQTSLPRPQTLPPRQPDERLQGWQPAGSASEGVTTFLGIYVMVCPDRSVHKRSRARQKHAGNKFVVHILRISKATLPNRPQ